jgi:RimJ/RimL family protein N-acetyltransferase
MTPRFRLAREADAPALAEVHVRSWQAAYRELLPADFLAALSISDRAERWRGRLREEQPPRATTIAELGGELVGFASICRSRDDDLADWLELNTIYLLPNAWGTGIAGPLLDAALVRDQPCLLWVFVDNQRAQGFYRKAGFVPDGATKTIALGGRTLTELRFRRPAGADESSADESSADAPRTRARPAVG